MDNSLLCLRYRVWHLLDAEPDATVVIRWFLRGWIDEYNNWDHAANGGNDGIHEK
jgi:hypothetical protein